MPERLLPPPPSSALAVRDTKRCRWHIIRMQHDREQAWSILLSENFLLGCLDKALSFCPERFFFIYLFFIHAAFLRLTKCSNDRPSLSSQHEWPYFIFITQRERSSAGQLHRLSLFHWKAININLWNASLWSESVVDQGMTGSSRRPDLLRLPQAVEFEGSLALWGLLTFSFLGRGPFSKGRQCHKCKIGALKSQWGCESFLETP